MPRQTVEIDVSSLLGRRELLAWCTYPDDAGKRAAYLAALHYEDRLNEEERGQAVEALPWAETKALGEQRKSAQEILEEGGKAIQKERYGGRMHAGESTRQPRR